MIKIWFITNDDCIKIIYYPPSSTLMVRVRCLLRASNILPYTLFQNFIRGLHLDTPCTIVVVFRMCHTGVSQARLYLQNRKLVFGSFCPIWSTAPLLQSLRNMGLRNFARWGNYSTNFFQVSLRLCTFDPSPIAKQWTRSVLIDRLY